MPVLLTAEKISKAFDSRPLFQSLQFGISTGERIGLIGPNGAGKSTLLKILAQEISADEGSVIYQKGIRIGYVSQTPSFQSGANILSTLLEGAQDQEQEPWVKETRAEELFWKLHFERARLSVDSKMEGLSGGWQKRVALARALMNDPDLLLLDEPTNHLDIEGILWLEDLIARSAFAVLTITHDRRFLQQTTNRILELDRRNEGGILSVKGNYETYLNVKEAMMTQQETREDRLRGVLRRETEWVKAGVKARTTKSFARIKQHAELSEEVAQIAERNVKRTSQLEFQNVENSPKRLLEAKNISKFFSEGNFLFKDLSVTLGPGTCLGILGENGCGKSTLIRVLLGQEPQSAGKIYRSDQLKVAYFEQNRESLDPETSLMRTICPFGDHVYYRGRQVHVRSYLDRFLFQQNQMDLPISKLSGGEQSRVLMAKLMLREANLLVLDEPTNDLDIATLQVLQDCLVEFDGAIILVSHDRFFLNQVSTELLAFPVTTEAKSRGEVMAFADLPQWESWHRAQLNEQMKAEEKRERAGKAAGSNSSVAATAFQPSAKKKGNSDQLVKKIEKLEGELAKCENEASKPEVMKDIKRLTEVGQKMAALQQELEALYSKWSEMG